MCYREEQSLDFSGMHMTSLTGDNGHGKSALLDAMTWALWGRARARRDDELITLNENEMWVDFEFSLGPQLYRVWRQRSKKGRGQSDLHFYIWNPGGNAGTGDWQLLDEGNLAQRQAQITRTLRLDYETFVNSAFLLQGRADSFTVKTPSERKQILADILGLSRYDAYEERAKGQVQARKERTIGIEAELKTIDAELARRDDYARMLSEAHQVLEAATAAQQLAQAQEAAARAQAQALRVQQQQLGELQARIGRNERELLNLHRQSEQARANLARTEAVLAQREEIEAGWHALETARAEEVALGRRWQQHSQLQERLAHAQRRVDQARADLVAEQRRLQARATELAAKAGSLEQHRRNLVQVQAVLAEMAGHAARRDAIAAELRDILESGAGLKHEIDRVKSEGQAVRERLELLEGAASANCPVCDQPLSPEHRQHAAGQLAAERDDLAERFKWGNAELKRLSERKSALEAEEKDLQQVLHARDARQRQLVQTETLIADCEAATAEQGTVAAQLADIDRRLEQEDFGGEARSELTRIRAEVVAVGYDRAAHESIRQEIDRLQPFDARYQRELLRAQDELPGIQSQCADLAGQIERRAGELEEENARRLELEQAVAQLPQLELQQKQSERKLQEADLACRDAQRREGAAQQNLDALDKLDTRRKLLRTDLDQLNSQISIFAELRDAFGKKGIQAMIIESAIPEVEVEANRLLQRMSEGRMNLRLETQREKVSGGGVIETLDIIIADELGARPYELFSGGEAFRANLALRIALSKLLARRGGCPAADPGHRRRVWLAGRARAGAGGGDDQLDQGRLPVDHRHQPYRRTERPVRRTHRRAEGDHRVARLGGVGVWGTT